MEYFLSFITSAFLGLIEQWVRNGLDKTPHEMTAIYIDIIFFIQNNLEPMPTSNANTVKDLL